MTVDRRNRLIGLTLAALIFLADQAIKVWVVAGLGLVNDGDQVAVTSFFAFTRTSNYGISLGFLTAQSMEMRWLLVLMTSAIAGVVLVWMLREKVLGEVLALALILGGALGNIRDRVRLGHVLDYADLHFGDFRPFLIFNLADAAITVGVAIILARSFLSREKRSQDAAAAAPET